MISREKAFSLLKEKVNSENLIKHSLAVEAAMQGMAEFLGKDKEKWGICGLLHDIDYEETKNKPSLHSKIGAEFLKQQGLDPEICEAVLSHNELHKIEPKTKMAQTLFVVDQLTGLIVASTLVLPSKKIADLRPESVLKKFREKAFYGICGRYLQVFMQYNW